MQTSSSVFMIILVVSVTSLLIHPAGEQDRIVSWELGMKLESLLQRFCKLQPFNYQLIWPIRLCGN